MAKKNPQSFGSTIEEVDSNIANLNAERKTLSENVGTNKFKKKDNRRFEQISSELEEANRQRSVFQPIASGGPEDAFTEQRTQVFSDPNVLPQQPGTATGLNTPTPEVGGINLGQQPLTSPGIGDIVIPESGSENIVQSTLEGINRPQTASVEDEINKSIFGGQPGTVAGKVAKAGAPLIQQGSEVLAGINDPILKGQVSGSIIGSQPIFVGGGDFLPANVINNRKKAIQDAANQRNAETNALLSVKPPIVKDQRFQGSLNQQFFSTRDSYVEEAKRKFGDDWDLALKDQSNPLGRGFVQDMANYDFIAGQTDQVTDLVGEIDENISTGDQFFSEETLNLRDEYNNLQGQFLNGDIRGTVNLQDQFGRLKGSVTLDKVINDQGIDIKGTVRQTASIIDNNDSFITTTQKKTEYENQLKVIATGLANDQMRDAVRSGMITEDEIFERLNARYGYESITTKKVTNKPGGGNIKVDIDLSGQFGEPKIEKIGGADITVVDAIEIPTGIKPVSASGLTFYNPDGTTSKVDGVRDVDLNSFQVVKVPDPNNPGQFINKKVVVGTHEVETDDGTFTETVIYDLDDMGSRIKSDVLQSPDQWDAMIDRFDAIEEKKPPELNSGVTGR